MAATRKVRSTKLRYPFQHKRVLGPGPQGHKIRQRLFWDCRCNNYFCRCRGAGGQRKRFRIHPGKKAAYGRLYRKWESQQRSRSTTRMAAYGDAGRLRWMRSEVAPERLVAGTTRGVYAVYPVGDRRCGLAFIPMRGAPMELGFFKSMGEAKVWAGKHASREMWSHVA